MFQRLYWTSLDVKKLSIGADGRTRTATGLLPLPPQDSVSTNSTTSATYITIDYCAGKLGRSESS